MSDVNETQTDEAPEEDTVEDDETPEADEDE
jgi:hypothetical protein